MEILSSHGLMFSPVQRNFEILNDPQALENEYIVDFEHPVLGKVKIPGYPIKFGLSSAGTRTAAPGLGEHSDLVMKKMGYSEEEIKKLKTEKVIK